jgi:hypothetical protein
MTVVINIAAIISYFKLNDFLKNFVTESKKWLESVEEEEDVQFNFTEGKKVLKRFQTTPPTTEQTLIFVNNLPYDLLLQIAPETASSHWFLKMPLILFVLSAGSMGALSAAFFTLASELHDIESGNKIVLSLFASGGVCGACDIFFINMAMKFYD